MRGKYRLATLGCKVHQYETEQVRELLESLGLRRATPDETPDIAVVNTCAVTATALAKSRPARRRRPRRGGSPVVVVGCGVAAAAARLRRIEGVVGVFGHDRHTMDDLRGLIVRRLRDVPTTPATGNDPLANHALERRAAGLEDVSMIPKAPSAGPTRDEPTPPNIQGAALRIIAPAPPDVKPGHLLTTRIARFDGRQRAFLKVQDGCDAFCTYCIIPRLRPNLRFKPIEVAVAEAYDLVQAGHKEIILTGIFLGAYGQPTALRRRQSRQASPLAKLVRAIARIDGLERLRLSSLEPGDVDGALLDVLQQERACVPHLHLPLQSGSESVLRRMNRQYTRDDYLAMVDRVQAALDAPAITTDIIVGFPGESDADFDASVEIARRVGFCKIHAFPFSPRENTAAATWTEDFIAPGVVQERMTRLRAVERNCSTAFRRGRVGSVERVIVEDCRRFDAQAAAGDNVQHGRTDRYFEVLFSAIGVGPGSIARVRIHRATHDRTYATYIPPDAADRTARSGDFVQVGILAPEVVARS